MKHSYGIVYLWYSPTKTDIIIVDCDATTIPTVPHSIKRHSALRSGRVFLAVSQRSSAFSVMHGHARWGTCTCESSRAHTFRVRDRAAAAAALQRAYVTGCDRCDWGAQICWPTNWLPAARRGVVIAIIRKCQEWNAEFGKELRCICMDCSDNKIIFLDRNSPERWYWNKSFEWSKVKDEIDVRDQSDKSIALTRLFNLSRMNFERMNIHL